MEHSNNYVPDIIATIEYEAANHLMRHPEMKVPPVVSLTKDQFKDYQNELMNGRVPKIKIKNKMVTVNARRIS